MFVPNVTPDVFVELSDDGKYRVRLEDGRTPTLYISPYYRKLLQSGEANEETREYIKRKLNSAQWLIDSGGIPARTDSLESQEFIEAEIGWWLQGFADQLGTSVAMAPINWGPVSEANMRAVNFVIYDERTPAEAAQWLYDQIMQLHANGEL